MAVDQHPVAAAPAEQLVERHAGHLALDVPQRGVDSGDRAHRHRPPPPVGPAIKVLPNVLDPRRIAELAALYQVRTGCHGATDLTPVCMGAALQFDTWVPNFGIQEYMRHSEETDAVFPHDYRFEDGFLQCGEAPGHGVEIDEALAAKYPYDPACLPVARLEDGTLWNW